MIVGMGTEFFGTAIFVPCELQEFLVQFLFKKALGNRCHPKMYGQLFWGWFNILVFFFSPCFDSIVYTLTYFLDCLIAYAA